MRRGFCISVTMAGLLLCGPMLPAQQTPVRLTFDVASIRPTKPGEVNGMIKALPGGHGYTAHNIPVKLMISLMYKVPMRQIKGGPEWLSERYDVEARVDGAYSVDDLHTMYKNLLADRFSLRFHTETKEGGVYALSVDPGGLKMKVNDSAQDFEIPVTYTANGSAVGHRVPMGYLSWWLGQQLQRDERPVVDLTGLKGNYDFTLSCQPVLAPEVSKDTLPPEQRDLPTLFDALRDQLGLRLRAEKGPVEYFLIDSVERPSEN